MISDLVLQIMVSGTYHQRHSIKILKTILPLTQSNKLNSKSSIESIRSSITPDAKIHTSKRKKQPLLPPSKRRMIGSSLKVIQIRIARIP